MDGAALDRFRKICGLLGSEHDGERASAALKASAMLKAAGLTWLHVGPAAKSGPMTNFGDLASLIGEVQLLRTMLGDERARNKRLSDKIEELKRDLKKQSGTELAPGEADDEGMRGRIDELLGEVDCGVVDLSERTVEFLRSVGGKKRWTEKQRDAVRRTLAWAANKARASA